MNARGYGTSTDSTRPSPELIELVTKLRVEQARGCPEQHPVPADSPAVCAARQLILTSAH
ncbi:hypothetical protein FDG2_1900 [Candidatus Protofrankia californiensis]|uniref:Uncharacterized protein n=1 Tax=Candidatus Protofrankia californiensis TaxID=1839754 RepID=A0A1C3NWK4_9ACTN|nr:hypothetical protein FDG2_1900 [Candidatus Protofrankia californiensis]